MNQLGSHDAAALAENALAAVPETIAQFLTEEILKFGIRFIGNRMNRDVPIEVPLPALLHTVAHNPDASVVSSEVASEISDFLHDPAIASILRAHFICSIAGRSAALRESGFDSQAFRNAFITAAERWASSRAQNWHSIAPEIWDATVSREYASDRKLSGIDADELVANFVFSDHNRGHISKHVDVLLRLAGDDATRASLAGLTQRCRQQAPEAFPDTFFVQGDEMETRFSDLYVDRTLIGSSHGLEVSPEIALSGHRSAVRAVVIGEPGAGKSTLVRWLLRYIAARTGDVGAAGITPLLIQCRDSFATPERSVLLGVREAFARTYSEEIDSATLENLLAVGEIHLVFDGLDEIQDQTQRDGIVRQIAGIARQYPMTPIVAATRRTGPEVQRLQGFGFRTYSLEQYSEVQVREYSDRWFAGKGTPERSARFITQSRNLVDLRSNPLMLSLLCTLFTRNDHIPQSRRGIYERCAALMFHEWDPKRGIQVPNIFKDRGTFILQNVASAIDRAGGYGASVRDDELHDLVKRYLESVGVAQVEADASARELIAYCTGRAWVLSAITAGNEVGFGFTHRTFYEFYLAESKVRSLNHAAQIGSTRPQPDSLQILPLTRAVWEAWKADPTSVLPELLIQAGDASTEGLSHLVIRELIGLSRHQLKSRAPDLVGLSVRLLAATGARPDVARDVLDSVVVMWKSMAIQGEDHEFLPMLRQDDSDGDWERYVDRPFMALLDMPSAIRDAFASSLLSDAETALEFQRRFARLHAAGEAPLYRDWSRMSYSLPSVDPNHTDPYILNMEFAQGKVDPDVALRHIAGFSAFWIGAQEGTNGIYWLRLQGQVSELVFPGERIDKRLATSVAREYYGAKAPLAQLDALAALENIRVATPMDPGLALTLAIISNNGSESRLAPLCLPASTAQWERFAELVELLRGLVVEARNSKFDDHAAIRSRIRSAFRGSPIPRPPSAVWDLALVAPTAPRRD